MIEGKFVGMTVTNDGKLIECLLKLATDNLVKVTIMRMTVRDARSAFNF